MAPCPEAQQVVTPPSAEAIFLVLIVAAGREDDAREVLADAGGIRRSVGFRARDDWRPTCSCMFLGTTEAAHDRILDFSARVPADGFAACQ